MNGRFQISGDARRFHSFETARAAAVALAEETARSAKKLRQQQIEAGKARGRWARLRTAWRGE